MKNAYKLTARKGRNIQVCLATNPSKWISTGTTDLASAHRFALARIGAIADPTCDLTITIKEYCRNFTNKLQRNDFLHNRTRKKTYYQAINSCINRYVIPLFGSCILQKLNNVEIEDVLIKFQSNELTKNRIIGILKLIFHQALKENLVNIDYTEKLENFKVIHKETVIFTTEELKKIFSKNTNFTSLKWELYFYLLRDTGWRPSEVLSLKYCNFKEDGGVYTESAVVNGELQNSIKTTNKGQSYKIGIISHFCQKLFKLSNLGANPSDFLFFINGRFPSTTECNRELDKILKKAEVEKRGRSQYSFRHTFNTLLFNKVAEVTRLELMGHTSNREEYDHRRAESALSALQKQEEVVDILQSLFT